MLISYFHLILIKFYELFFFPQGNDVTEEDCSSPSNGKGNYGDHPSPFTPDLSPPFAFCCSQAM